MAWSVWPLPRQTVSLTLTRDLLAVPGSTGSLEGRVVRLDYPAAVRLGQIGQISMTLVPEPAGAARTAKVNVEAEAWLGLSGSSVVPGDVTSAAVLAGRTNRFDWQVIPDASQGLEGRAWLYFRLIPSDGSPETRKPISAQPVSIQVLSLAGVDQTSARWAGAIAALVGIICTGWGRVWGKPRPRRLNNSNIKKY